MNKNYLLRVMRITLFFMLLGMLCASASSYSQQITLKGNKIPFSSVLDAIRQQSGYTVFSTKSILSSASDVTIDVKKMPLFDFLKIVTANQPIDYQIEDRTISFVRR